MDGIFSAPVTTAVASILAALIAGVVAAYTTQRKSRVDVQASLNAGFNLLFEQQKAQMNDMSKVITEQREQIRVQALKIRDLERDIARLKRGRG